MAFHIDAGQLNRRVKIEKKTLATDAYGDEAQNVWSEVCTVWGQVTPVSAREFWEAQAAHGELTHKITIRYRSDVSAEMRCVVEGRVLDLTAPPVDYGDEHRYLVLKCRDVTT